MSVSVCARVCVCVCVQAPSGLTDGGYKKRGSLAVSKIDAAGFYYLNIEGEPGHALKCILQVRVC